jgi:hypothetical protein
MVQEWSLPANFGSKQTTSGGPKCVKIVWKEATTADRGGVETGGQNFGGKQTTQSGQNASFTNGQLYVFAFCSAFD